ncbi:MAG: quinone-interacting membrane-bound oxidoreductase complex subunit QmoC [candidate division Zixibacteria bacterium]|jgi:quinone-modifying oxidoreductase subunit QmoC|nr:quinone-interacting membrane-bound oxidoreductase complex subunit QmoC [candidate division Zixibacteria bacterium]
MAARRLVEPDLALIREVKRVGGDTVKRCYQCATCSVVCSLSPADRPFPRKEMILAQWGQRDQLVADPDIWLCHQCNDCTQRCPRGARPGDVLAAVRSYVYEYFAFPRFMGKALATPAALSWLILTPILLLAAAVLAFAPRTPDGAFAFLHSTVVDFDIFLPHSSVDALFVFGNILVFLFAAIGFKRFWNGLQAGNPGERMSFVSGLVLTVKEIFAHSRFRSCDANRARATAHMLLLFGFVGAMITTGCVFVFVFIPHYLHLLGLESMSSFFGLPIELPHPVKILGAASGLALVIGGAMAIYRRWSERDRVGANGYTDYLFLYVLFVVGLTGMLSWLVRWAGLALPAYTVYFIHMVSVFFLLWYMPYSKFAHMIYRTLALVYARQINRLPRS